MTSLVIHTVRWVASILYKDVIHVMYLGITWFCFLRNTSKVLQKSALHENSVILCRIWHSVTERKLGYAIPGEIHVVSYLMLFSELPNLKLSCKWLKIVWGGFFGLPASLAQCSKNDHAPQRTYDEDILRSAVLPWRSFYKFARTKANATRSPSRWLIFGSHLKKDG